MSIARILVGFAVSGLALGGCAYVPEAAEPSWTDAQLDAAPPSEAPAYIADERLDAMTFYRFYLNQTELAERRDAVQAAGAQIPDPEGRSEDFAAAARERAEPPEPQ